MLKKKKESRKLFLKIVVPCFFLFVIVCGVWLTGYANCLWKNGIKAFEPVLEKLQFAYDNVLHRFESTLNDVLIDGVQRTNFHEIEQAINLNRNLVLAYIDIYALKKRIEDLPWVDQVLVQRIFPDMIMIKISEHKPVALWQNNGKYLVITARGKVLDEKAIIFASDDIPLIAGKGAPAKTPALLKELTENVEVLARLKAAVLVDERRWDLILDDVDKGLVIKLPEDNEFAALKRLKNLQEKFAILKRKLTLIDLRLPDKLAVRL